VQLNVRRVGRHVVLYHCCISLDRAREIAREGFSAQQAVPVTEHLAEEHARAPDESHAVVVLGVSWEFRLKDYPLDGSIGAHLVPAHVLNLFERAVWSV